MIRERVFWRVKRAFIRIMLGRRLFTGGVVIIGAKQLIVTGPLALETCSVSYICREDFVNE
jgi:hypothetical protein